MARRLDRRSGLTLVELLVVVTIIMLFGGFFGALINESTSGWNFAMGVAEAHQEARVLMNRMEAQLRIDVWRGNSGNLVTAAGSSLIYTN